MLLKYIVSNYKSIGHSIEFSMLPTKDNKDNKFTTTISTKMGEWKVLRRGALFGPNASGKSSFMESINFARDYIVKGQPSGRKTLVNQFKGNFEDLNGITTFQFMFYLNEEVFDYGFSLDNQRVHDEWLMIMTSKGFEPMFERETDVNLKTNIDITPKFARKGSKERKLAEILKDSIKEDQKNQLFLYKLYDNGIKKITEIFEWFKDIQVIFPGSKLQGLELRIAQNNELAKYLSILLNSYDTGVNKVFSTKRNVKFKKLLADMEVPDEIIQDIYDKKSGIVNIKGKLFIFNEEEGETILYEIKFEHTLNGKNYNFDKENESDGTQRLLDLLPILFDIENKSKMYFIDELDRSLHTLLTKNILSNFIKCTMNTNNQMVITAHDVNLIDLKDMSTEEIWFLQKNKNGETTINPFSNYNVDNEYDTIKAYFAGRFGAIPLIKEEY